MKLNVIIVRYFIVVVVEKYCDRIEFGAGLILGEGFGRDVRKIKKALPDF